MGEVGGLARRVRIDLRGHHVVRPAGVEHAENRKAVVIVVPRPVARGRRRGDAAVGEHLEGERDVEQPRQQHGLADPGADDVVGRVAVGADVGVVVAAADRDAPPAGGADQGRHDQRGDQLIGARPAGRVTGRGHGVREGHLGLLDLVGQHRIGDLRPVGRGVERGRIARVAQILDMAALGERAELLAEVHLGEVGRLRACQIDERVAHGLLDLGGEVGEGGPVAQGRRQAAHVVDAHRPVSAVEVGHVRVARGVALAHAQAILDAVAQGARRGDHRDRRQLVGSAVAQARVAEHAHPEILLVIGHAPREHRRRVGRRRRRRGVEDVAVGAVRHDRADGREDLALDIVVVGDVAVVGAQPRAVGAQVVGGRHRRAEAEVRVVALRARGSLARIARRRDQPQRIVAAADRRIRERHERVGERRLGRHLRGRLVGRRRGDRDLARVRRERRAGRPRFGAADDPVAWKRGAARAVKDDERHHPGQGAARGAGIGAGLLHEHELQHRRHEQRAREAQRAAGEKIAPREQLAAGMPGIGVADSIDFFLFVPTHKVSSGLSFKLKGMRCCSARPCTAPGARPALPATRDR